MKHDSLCPTLKKWCVYISLMLPVSYIYHGVQTDFSFDSTLLFFIRFIPSYLLALLLIACISIIRLRISKRK